MRAIIDTTVQNADKYYRTYLVEPSPIKDISLSFNDILSTKEISFALILAEMKKLGKDGELLVVTHSGPGGFKMPLMEGAQSSLLFAGMDVMLKIAEGIRRREALRALPPSKLPPGWKEWFRDFEPGIVLGAGFEQDPTWQRFVEKKYGEWHARQGKQILKLAKPEHLDQLAGLLNDVRALGFARLEFRACRIGTDADNLKVLASFLQVKTVVGPKEVRTFYGVIAKADIVADPRKFAELVRKTPSTHAFDGVALQILPTTFRAFATADDQPKAFVKKFISSTFNGTTRPFVIGGLEPSGQAVIAGKPHVFPLESDYKKLLTSFTTP